MNWTRNEVHLDADGLIKIRDSIPPVTALAARRGKQTGLTPAAHSACRHREELRHLANPEQLIAAKAAAPT